MHASTLLLFSLSLLLSTLDAKIAKRPFGQTAQGKPVDLYTLTNKNGMEAAITNYGGIVVALKTADKQGRLADVVLGFDSLDGYKKEHPYFGALVGRYGNRIQKGQFALNGKTYKLANNNGPNALHGGLVGFDKVVWTAREVPPNRLELTHTSPDMHEGFPGNLNVKVTYTLTDANELQIDYEASTDKPTVLNLTNHSYFNLAGQGNGDVLKHQIRINADRFTPVDSTLIPTGELKAVKGTPFDFTQPHAIGERINQTSDEQIKFGGGYDHNFVLNKTGSGPALAAEVYEPTTGRVMQVLTTEPGVQFYTGNFLDGTLTGKQGKVYRKRYGFCLETQHFPDSPNRPEFPSVVLKPGETYRSTTIYRFSAR
ncbi:MAG: galactose mutarotase [Bryobacterales bacterium]|nr:galactose mutarotase [Bryobacterales bacterium]